MSAPSPVRTTPFHPKWHRPPVSVWWWLKSRPYAKFVLRELTSVFVAFFSLVLLWQLRALSRGPEAYEHFLARLRSPLFIAFDALAFLFVLFHAVTWFNLAPKALALRLSGRRVADGVIVGLNYAAWLALSAGVALFLLRG
ncbi:MAG: hypothetical protein ACM3JH_00970 [Acidithiobacillales bacterium]